MGLLIALNDWDRRLLDKHLKFYLALDSGERAPATPAQRHFVEVCRSKAAPSTQHEIAFAKWKAAVSQGPSASDSIDIPDVPDKNFEAPSSTLIAIVDAVEEAQFEAKTAWGARTLERIGSLYRSGQMKAKEWSSDAAVWAAAALSDPDFSLQIDRLMRDQWGGLSNIYTKAMDGSYLQGLKSGEEYVSPWIHRLLDHDIGTSMQRVRDALPNDTFTEEAIGWLRAYTSDLGTPAGVPFVSLTKVQIDSLEKIASHFDVPLGWLHDALSVNGTELVASAIPGIALALNWKRGDAERFAEICGSLIVGAGVAANPVLAIVALAALAKAWDKSKNEDDGKVRVVEGLTKGAALSGVVLSVAATLGGTPIVGVVAGVGLAAALRVKGKNFNSVVMVEWLRGLVPANRLHFAAVRS